MIGLSAPPLDPEMSLPADDRLAGLPHLFDNQWVWEAFCTHFGAPEETPRRIRPRQIRYQPGRRALVGYAAEWRWGRWVEEDQFAVELVAGEPERLVRYPDDRYLPGLQQAASASDAHRLLTKHVPISPQLLLVETVRYRPGTRAVLRHIATWRRARGNRVTLFVRVMPPARVSRLMGAAELVERSGFALPRLAGCWPEGGVAWLTQMPGSTVRTLIREGTATDPEPILDGLARLWSGPMVPQQGQALDVSGGFRMTRRLLSRLLQGEEARSLLRHLEEALGRFSAKWTPTALAHNDFYDDQILVTPDGRLALVDFEEAGPGDPLFDVGNMLAHLRWMARFGAEPEHCAAYHRRFRAAALDRFGWDGRALDMREAFTIFRMSCNPFRQLRRNWPSAVEAGLSLAANVLEGEP